MQIVENERSELNHKKSQLQTTACHVDRNNKRWDEAWFNNFPAGSPERNAFSDVDTEVGTTAPSELEIQSLTQIGLSVAVAYVPNTGQRATALVSGLASRLRRCRFQTRHPRRAHRPDDRPLPRRRDDQHQDESHQLRRHARKRGPDHHPDVEAVAEHEA